MQLVLIIERVEQLLEPRETLQTCLSRCVLANGALQMPRLLTTHWARAGEKCGEPIRQPGFAARISLRGKRVQPGRLPGADLIVGTTKGAHRHFQTLIFVKEKQACTNPLGLRHQKRSGEGLACAHGAEHDCVPCGRFFVGIAGFVEIKSVAGGPHSWKHGDILTPGARAGQTSLNSAMQRCEIREVDR